MFWPATGAVLQITWRTALWIALRITSSTKVRTSPALPPEPEIRTSGIIHQLVHYHLDSLSEVEHFLPTGFCRKL